MFKKILIANRGEIACRVIKSARAMNIQTVALYSDADKKSLHVQMADEAIHIGPAAAAESYLVIDKIIQACKDTGAEAVHPGYGFLSERAEFAERLSGEKLTFIGPPVGAINAMGDKITSKKLAAEAGVSTVPGYMGLIDDAEHAVKIAAEIGYPVMIKASAGGGGKGMRIAWNDEEAREGFDRSKSEASSSFGDDRIFIEKFIEEPRHIEIQVLADKHGNCIYLGERECSIQRRNQKVIEEAPSPFLDEATRQKMGEQAVALSKAVDYASAGTVEFIVDKNRNFYFLEMNTRLQVEHPVTELITGVDLVEQMLRVASGEKLALKQNDIELNGWAMESRLYAEDPYRNFLPSIGRLSRYRPPVEGRIAGDNGEDVADAPIIRNDTGVYEGGEISMFYDPMIAKLCTWGKDRDTAIDTMVQALDQFEVEGIGHNLPFCAAVMKHPRFRSGNITTAFIEEEYPDGFSGAPLSENELSAMACIAATMKWHDEQRKSASIDADRFAAGPSTHAQRQFVVGLNGQSFAISVGPKPGENPGTFEVELGSDDESVNLEIHSDYERGRSKFVATSVAFSGATSTRYFIQCAPLTTGYRLRNQGADLAVSVLPPRTAVLLALMPGKLPPDTSNLLLCPMPGLIVKLDVAVGDAVEEGQSLAIVEAMKMENILRAEKAGTVKSIPVSVGDSLAVDEIIMEFEK